MAYDPSGKGVTGFPPGAVLNPDGTITYGGQTYPNGSFMSGDGSVHQPSTQSRTEYLASLGYTQDSLGNWIPPAGTKGRSYAPDGVTPNGSVDTGEGLTTADEVAVAQGGTSVGNADNHGVPRDANGNPVTSASGDPLWLGGVGLGASSSGVINTVLGDAGRAGGIVTGPVTDTGEELTSGIEGLGTSVEQIGKTGSGEQGDPFIGGTPLDSIGDLLDGLFGGGRKPGTADPYVVKQPPPIDSTPYTQPLRDVGNAAQSSAAGYAGQQADLAKQLLAAPSAAAAAGNAMAERTAQENAAQLASARGANTALLLRQAAGSADARTRGIASDVAALSAKEQQDRYGVSGNLLNQAAGTASTGYGQNLTAAGQAGTIGAETAAKNNANQIAAEGINASSHDATDATNAGIGRDQGARDDAMMDRWFKTGGTILEELARSGDDKKTSSDIRNKQNIRPLEGARFGDLLKLATGDTARAEHRSRETPSNRSLLALAAGRGEQTKPTPPQLDMRRSLELAASPEGNRETLAPIAAFRYEYDPATAARPGNDGAPRPGVLTRDLLKSAAGAQTVVDTPNGEAIDVNRGLSLSLAANAGLDKRITELEQMVARDDEQKRKHTVPSVFTGSQRTLARAVAF